MEKYFDEFAANWNLHLRYFMLYWNFGLFVYTQNLNFLRLINYFKIFRMNSMDFGFSWIFYPGQKNLDFPKLAEKVRSCYPGIQHDSPYRFLVIPKQSSGFYVPIVC